MDAINNGGPAFPVVQTYPDYDRNSEQHYPNTFSEGGMSLRDYFAAKAPDYTESWFNNHARSVGIMNEAVTRAAWNYQYADAMLAAREVRP